METFKYWVTDPEGLLEPDDPPYYYEPLVYERLVPPVMEYDEKVTVDSKGPRYSWKPFEHYKMVLDKGVQPAVHELRVMNADINDWRWGMTAPVTDAVKLAMSSAHVGYYPPQGLPSWRDNGVSSDVGFTPLPKDLVVLEQTALRAIMPRIKAEISLLNAVYELKDFKHLALTAKRAVGKLYQVGLKPGWALFQQYMDRSLKEGPTFSSLARLAAGGYLQWKFAIAPLISDVQSTWTALVQTEKKLRKFLDNAEKVREGHFSVDLNEYVDTDETSNPEMLEWRPSLGAGHAIYRKVRKTVSYKPSKFHVQIEYSYHLLDLQIAHSRLFAYLDAFGLNLNPAIIWNAIPFTFIIDWVIGVSRFLDRMGAGFMDPVVFIHRYLWSIKRERRIDGVIYLRQVSPGSTAWYQPYRLPSCIETSYRRETTMPSKSLFLTTSGLTPVELSLGAALLIARKSRKYRRLRA